MHKTHTYSSKLLSSYFKAVRSGFWALKPITSYDRCCLTSVSGIMRLPELTLGDRVGNLLAVWGQTVQRFCRVMTLYIKQRLGTLLAAEHKAVYSQFKFGPSSSYSLWFSEGWGDLMPEMFIARLSGCFCSAAPRKSREKGFKRKKVYLIVRSGYPGFRGSRFTWRHQRCLKTSRH